MKRIAFSFLFLVSACSSVSVLEIKERRTARIPCDAQLIDKAKGALLVVFEAKHHTLEGAMARAKEEACAYGANAVLLKNNTTSVVSNVRVYHLLIEAYLAP